MYLKACALRGSLQLPCLVCAYYCDPIGCKNFRDAYHALVVYVDVYDSIASLLLKDFLGRFVDE